MPNEKSVGMSDFLRKIAAVLGASGVALGAIGAHAFKDTLTKRGTTASWQTATMYQLFHATAIFSLSSRLSIDEHAKMGMPSSKPETISGNSRMTFLAGQLLSLGTILFSGSIYCLALNVGPKALLGPTTPIGGLLMIGGWVVVGLS
ncbi:DUF423 domain containing protein [Nitzschia inconspicua]|uniref:DUF423 domain containing protein n=1 Tax=Nitzschia inconspicua TaxID=303405 RepID=A0A9K3Q3Y4_9STRA|nr:DUF423 domain containing protein [Nitzschia inconspicua]